MTHPIEQSDFNLLYQDQLDVLRELKDKAWKTTHYSVLAQAAIIALDKATLGYSMTHQVLLTFLSILVLVWALGLVNLFQWQIGGRREALIYLRELRGCGAFRKSFQIVWKEVQRKKLHKCCNNKEQTKASYLNRWFVRVWESDWEISIAFGLAIITPFIVALVSIWQC